MKHRLRKLGFRTTGVILGLWLGWQAAGFADDSHADVQIAPSEAQGSWYPMVIGIAVALFVAAIAIGPLAMKFKGDEPADDDHGHDDHGDHGDHGDDKHDH